jgi:hypothetical protein
MGIVRAPGCTLAASSFTTAGQTPTTPKSPCVMVQHVCMRVYAGQNEEEESMREREVQPSFSPLGTTGNSSMSFTSCAWSMSACGCMEICRWVLVVRAVCVGVDG